MVDARIFWLLRILHSRIVAEVATLSHHITVSKLGLLGKCLHHLQSLAHLQSDDDKSCVQIRTTLVSKTLVIPPPVMYHFQNVSYRVESQLDGCTTNADALRGLTLDTSAPSWYESHAKKSIHADGS
jgi:hypothetical protein